MICTCLRLDLNLGLYVGPGLVVYGSMMFCGCYGLLLLAVSLMNAVGFSLVCFLLWFCLLVGLRCTSGFG